MDVCRQLANRGIRVIVAGLDMDYLGNMGITATVASYISTGKNMFSKAIASKSAATNSKLDEYRANVKKVADK